MATALRGVRGGFLKTSDEVEDTPTFDRALLITIPLLLILFMAMSYFITEREVQHLKTHLSRQVESVRTEAEIAQFPEYLHAQQAANSRVNKFFITTIIDGKRVKLAFSAAEAHRRADLIQGLMLVFVLLTTACVVHMNQSLTSDHKEEGEDSLLNQFLSPSIVDQINTNPEELERFYSRWLSVFFVAIRGSTRAIGTESNDIEALALLRRRVMDIVRQQTVVVHQGILDKEIGRNNLPIYIH